MLRPEFRQHFASIDHAILLASQRVKISEQGLMALTDAILARRGDVLSEESCKLQLSACRSWEIVAGSTISASTAITHRVRVLRAQLRGWIAHAAHADFWGLRRHPLDAFRLKPGYIPGRSRR